MNKLKFVFWGMAVVLAGVLLLSCTPTIKGELTLLVENHLEATYSPCWSWDGSKIYFIHSEGPGNHDEPGQIWSVNVVDQTLELICEDTFRVIDVSRQDNLCLPTWYNGDDWIRVVDIETWTTLDSILPEHIYGYPRFSMESSQIIYYIDREQGWDSTLLHKVDLISSTDEIILVAGRGYSVAPGPGDTLFAIGAAIYNINSGERIYLDLDTLFDTTLDWNPARPSELLIYQRQSNRDVLLFDLETQETRRVDLKPDKAKWIETPTFSPDGKKIAFQAAQGGDGFYDYQIWIFDFED